MDSYRPILKKSQLRQLAKQGNEAALVQLLNQALAHKKIRTVVTIANDCFKISLYSPQILDAWASKVLIDRELLQLHQAGTFTIELEAYQEGDGLPVWTEKFLLGSQAKIRPNRIQSQKRLPVKYPEINRKKYPLNLPPKNLDSASLESLGIGFILAVILQIFAPLRVLFNGFEVLVHEIGHAVTHWLFGYPAIPSVDLVHGGGVTLSLEQSPLVIGLIYGAIAWGLYQYPNSRYFFLGLAGVYTGLLLTPLSNILMVFMGHGMELCAIIICLYFAAGGYFCQSSIERPLYAMLGFFLLFSDLRFFWGLIVNSDLRYFYEAGKGGVIDNDFVVLSRDYLNVNLDSLAQLFILGVMLTPMVAFLLFRYEKLWQAVVYRIIVSN